MEILVPLLTAVLGGGAATLIKSWFGRRKDGAEAFKSYTDAHSLILSDLTTEVRRLSQHVYVLESALRNAGLHVPSVPEIEQLIHPSLGVRPNVV